MSTHAQRRYLVNWAGTGERKDKAASVANKLVLQEVAGGPQLSANMAGWESHMTD